MARFVVCMAIGVAAVGGGRSADAAGDARSNDHLQLEGRSWTPADSVGVRYILTKDQILLDMPSTREVGSDSIVPSPQGRYFFFVTRHGDLDCDCNVYELSVFDVEDVDRAFKEKTPIPRARRTVIMRHKEQAIQAAAWVDGESGIEFTGIRTPGGRKQIYRLDVATGELRELTQVSDPKTLVRYARHRDGMIYTTMRTTEAEPEYPMYALTEERLKEILYAHGQRRRYVFESFVSYAGQAAWRLKSGWVFGPPWLSPDGRYAIAQVSLARAPENWKKYDGRDPSRADKPIEVDEFKQFVLIDLQRGTEEPVFDAPTGQATQSARNNAPEAFWSADGRTFVLVNTALPLLSEDTAPDRAKQGYIVSYDLESRKWEVLEPMRRESGIRAVKPTWRKPGEEILVRHQLNGKPVEGTIYTYRDARWVPRAVSASVNRNDRDVVKSKPVMLGRGVFVRMRQSANDPPVVVASRKGQEIVLTPPDPALVGVWRTRVESLDWRDEAGVTRTSGLLLPRDIPVGERVPLVIQAQVYRPDEFNPDGPIPTAYAAQSLVAQGMAVLNLTVPTYIREVQGTGREVSMFIDWWESAAEAAARHYPIDLDKVALIGFSRTGYLVRYAITHPRLRRPAAAVIADSYTGSYMLSLLGHATGDGTATGYDSIYGGPFYQSKQSWLEREVSFNVDRVQTPVLFADNTEILTDMADTIGAFKANRKPFEYLLFPDADHMLRGPRQREASMGATVDWMAFWLQGKEDPRREKSEQYQRWRELRRLHDQQE